MDILYCWYLIVSSVFSALCVITVSQDNEIEWDRRRVARFCCHISRWKMTPFSFLLAIAIRPTSHVIRCFVTVLLRDRVAGSKQLTVTRESVRGMKRGRSWNDEPPEGVCIIFLIHGTLRYCLKQRDTFVVNAASKPLIRARARCRTLIVWRFLFIINNNNNLALSIYKSSRIHCRTFS